MPAAKSGNLALNGVNLQKLDGKNPAALGFYTDSGNGAAVVFAVEYSYDGGNQWVGPVVLGDPLATVVASTTLLTGPGVAGVPLFPSVQAAPTHVRARRTDSDASTAAIITITQVHQ